MSSATDTHTRGVKPRESHPLFTSLAVLLMVLSSASARAQDGRVVLREVVQDREHLRIIYEVTTSGSVIPQTLTVIQPSHSAQPTLEDEVLIQRNCEQQHHTGARRIEGCVQKQTSALRELIHISASVEADAGLTNVVETCMSGSKLREGYDWETAKQCYDRQREVFARVYGR